MKDVGESHRYLYKYFYDNNYQYGIIFEDDFKIINDVSPIINNIKNIKYEWDVILLHENNIIFEKIDNYFSHGIGISMIGYIVSRNYLKKFVKNNKFNFPKTYGYNIDIEMFLNPDASIFTNKVYICNEAILSTNEKVNSSDINTSSYINKDNKRKFLEYNAMLHHNICLPHLKKYDIKCSLIDFIKWFI